MSIAGVSSTAIAGCSNFGGNSEDLYEQGNEEELVPDGVGDDWPDDEFERNDGLNENFLRVFSNPDESIIVLMDAEISEAVEDAEDSFESSEATASDADEYPLADEALISDDGEAARVIFRQANAIGQTLAARESGIEVRPDRQRASEYAEIMYEDEW